MRVDTKEVTFIEGGRLIIDGAEYRPLSSDAVLGEVSSLTNIDIFKQALDKWGKSAQIIIAIEELSELSKALCKSFREFNNDDIIDEMADVIIMIEQLKLIIGQNDKLTERIDYKIKRLKERLEISA